MYSPGYDFETGEASLLYTCVATSLLCTCVLACSTLVYWPTLHLCTSLLYTCVLVCSTLVY